MHTHELSFSDSTGTMSMHCMSTPSCGTRRCARSAPGKPTTALAKGAEPSAWHHQPARGPRHLRVGWSGPAEKARYKTRCTIGRHWWAQAHLGVVILRRVSLSDPVLRCSPTLVTDPTRARATRARTTRGRATRARATRERTTRARTTRGRTTRAHARMRTRHASALAHSSSWRLR